MEKFFINEYALAGIFLILILISYFLLFLLLRARIQNRKLQSQQKATLGYQREHHESKIYDEQTSLIADPQRFVDVNNLLFSYSPTSFTDDHICPNDGFLREMGISPVKIEDNSYTAVCLMPFHKQFDKVYDNIKEACSTSGFECHRSDDEFISGNILRNIVKLIVESRIVIAVINGRNPNVMYEIGLAHALGKNVIMVAEYKQVGDIPFNLAPNKFILYRNWGELKEQLSKSLKMLVYDKSK